MAVAQMLVRSVPLARRNLFADRRRLIASVVGVGLAVMLILLLDGMWAGLRAQARLYTDRAGADLYVLQPGVRDLTAGASVLPLGAVDAVRADPGVSWAAPVRSAYVVLQVHGTKVASSVVGSVPGQRGGVWSLASGRAPAADDEVAVDRVLAGRHGLGVGDALVVAGRRFRVVGLADHSYGFMVPFVFVTHSALDELSGSPGSTSFVLLGADEPAAVAARLRAQGLNVLTSDQVAANDVEFTTGVFGSPIRIMVGIGLAAGTLVIALTAYTTIVEHRREYGIVKGMGVSGGRLMRLALVQTIALAGLGLAVGAVLFLAGRALIVASRPQFAVVLTAGSVGRAALAALTMALLAAAIPARRLARMEPAAAYRSAP
jgi:putative ABC transport system permease protein